MIQIRQYPEVPAAVELTDVARFAFGTGFVFPDPTYDRGWVWQGDAEFDPALRIVVPEEQRVQKGGRYLIKAACMVMIDGMTEYQVKLPVVGANQIETTPFLEDFVDAFRQFKPGRSGLILPEQAEY